ncbi:thiamine biosynthesis protein ApbE [Azospirillum sp. TSH100]|uniref:FAD:protein FMN transferase n=1 Tax=Azospirillum sp. TSH100 TaxID=652764 RepID=UPI000D61CA19|nr:FAD:protein FMN transferase [Azospirillum sp. TSH100]PWC88268.1 thiamine biosynthesis protein ApbE [Azospirillum sp. TSH100]QCG90441.1 FAD:protein FMN transferase [Azospirillum sp. TSH100]
MSPSLTRPLARRRFLAIGAVAAGLSLLPHRLLRAEGISRGVPVRTWRGVALGADASLSIAHPDAAEADRLIALSLEEVARLERVFSLYRGDSALRRLNRDGRLDDPPADLVRLLSEATAFGRGSGGAFDPTVQPLWQLYAGHFEHSNADPAGPPENAVRAARALVDARALRVEPDRIAFAIKGMAVTLNGIAQGYITDRVTERLKAEGIGNVLVDMGELRTLGHHPSGRPWTVGLADPTDPEKTTGTIELTGGAMATSGGYGTRFDAAGRFTHLFDPASGACAAHWLAVTVQAADATTADALSTALSVVPADRAAAILAAYPGVTARFTHPDGRVLRLPA